jgi:hypothetical protein
LSSPSSFSLPAESLAGILTLPLSSVPRVAENLAKVWEVVLQGAALPVAFTTPLLPLRGRACHTKSQVSKLCQQEKVTNQGWDSHANCQNFS